MLREVGDIPINAHVLGFIYLKKSMFSKAAASVIKPSGIKALYGVCVFLAYKFLIEEDYWPLEEFSKLVGVKAYTLFKYEVFVIDRLLNYNLHVRKEEYDKEMNILKRFGKSKK